MSVSRCTRCKRAMHPAQNSRRAPDGIICMACFDGPRILWFEPEHNRIKVVLPSTGTVTVRAHRREEFN